MQQYSAVTTAIVEVEVWTSAATPEEARAKLERGEIEGLALYDGGLEPHERIHERVYEEGFALEPDSFGPK